MEVIERLKAYPMSKDIVNIEDDERRKHLCYEFVKQIYFENDRIIQIISNPDLVYGIDKCINNYMFRCTVIKDDGKKSDREYRIIHFSTRLIHIKEGFKLNPSNK